MAGAGRPPRVTSCTRGSVRVLHWWPTPWRAPWSFFIVPAATPASLQRLLHRVSTVLALVSEHRIPALVLVETRPTHRRPALHALQLPHREPHARARPRGSATSPDEPTVERHDQDAGHQHREQDADDGEDDDA